MKSVSVWTLSQTKFLTLVNEFHLPSEFIEEPTLIMESEIPDLSALNVSHGHEHEREKRVDPQHTSDHRHQYPSHCQQSHCIARTIRCFWTCCHKKLEARLKLLKLEYKQIDLDWKHLCVELDGLNEAGSLEKQNLSWQYVPLRFGVL